MFNLQEKKCSFVHGGACSEFEARHFKARHFISPCRTRLALLAWPSEAVVARGAVLALGAVAGPRRHRVWAQGCPAPQ